jgi:hypothetical protein
MPIGCMAELPLCATLGNGLSRTVAGRRESIRFAVRRGVVQASGLASRIGRDS